MDSRTIVDDLKRCSKESAKRTFKEITNMIRMNGCVIKWEMMLGQEGAFTAPNIIKIDPYLLAESEHNCLIHTLLHEFCHYLRGLKDNRFYMYKTMNDVYKAPKEDRKALLEFLSTEEFIVDTMAIELGDMLGYSLKEYATYLTDGGKLFIHNRIKNIKEYWKMKDNSMII